MVLGLQPRTHRTQMVAPPRPPKMATLTVNQTPNNGKRLPSRRKTLEQQNPPEDHNRAHRRPRSRSIGSTTTGGRTRTQLPHDRQAGTPQELIVKDSP
ncbi:hypothetical protein HMPREF9621_02550 [Cutibacterium modestum HL037PA2]|nr:hypothetical protein HMPREF9621_02550 [Cutibacterium modestum HL037PA2]